MITVNLELCKKCGVCLNRFKGFCLSDAGGHPEIDYFIGNGRHASLWKSFQFYAKMKLRNRHILMVRMAA